MARLKRVTHKLFAENAPVVESGNTSVEIGQFGSALAGTYVATNDVATLQALPAYTRGWGGAVIADEQLPTLEDMNAVQRVQSYQTGYLFQEGIAEYDASSEYGIGSICKVIEGTDVKLYKSLIADNVGNPITDTNSWDELSFGGCGLEIGDIGFTQMAIDESLGKRRKLNGSIIVKDQYPVLAQIIETTQALFPDNFCTEEEWQTEVSAYGICGKYVVGTDTIRLPKYPEYLIAGLTNTVPVVGNGMTLGLTNGRQNAGLQSWALSGSNNYFAPSLEAYGTEVGANIGGTGLNGRFGVTTDATKSGIVAQLDQAGNKIYGTYFIQVATGSEYQENITNEIELNNPFVLLEGQYFTAPVYNSSWLQSNAGYTGSLALHPTAYNALLIEQNPNVEVGTTIDNYTKRGLSVKLDTEAYTDYDFVLNTTSQTFRCPLKLRGTSDEGLYLYFYVGETLQNTSIVNVGRVEEKLSDCITRSDCKAYIVETSPKELLPSWYRVYSDGWCEQGGQNSASQKGTLTFLKSFVDVNYSINATLFDIDYGAVYFLMSLNTKTSSSVGYISTGGSSRVGCPFSWVACGYIR